MAARHCCYCCCASAGAATATASTATAAAATAAAAAATAAAAAAAAIASPLGVPLLVLVHTHNTHTRTHGVQLCGLPSYTRTYYKYMHTFRCFKPLPPLDFCATAVFFLPLLLKLPGFFLPLPPPPLPLPRQSNRKKNKAGCSPPVCTRCDCTIATRQRYLSDCRHHKAKLPAAPPGLPACQPAYLQYLWYVPTYSYLPVCLSVCLSVCLYVHLPVCFPVYLPACLCPCPLLCMAYQSVNRRRA